MSWLDKTLQFFGYATIESNGTALPVQATVNFIGATVVDNPSLSRTDVTLPGVQTASAVPVSGTWTAGTILFNSAPSGTMDHAGWYCYQSGTPGLWQPFGREGAFEFDVSKFGAVPNNINLDQSSEIQACIDAANATAIAAFNPNGTGYFTEVIVYFPNGRYKCCVDVPANIKLRGDHQTQLISADGMNRGAVNFAGYNNVVESLGFFGERFSVTVFGWSAHYGAFIGAPSNGSTGLTCRDTQIRSEIGPALYLDDTGRFTTLATPAVAGQPTIVLTAVVNPSMVAPGSLLLVETATGTMTVDYKEVLSVSGTTITFTTNLDNSYSSGDFVGYTTQARGSAAQFLVVGAEIEGASAFYGGSNAVVYRDCYAVQRYTHKCNITTPASAGQPTVVVDSTASISPGDLVAFGGPSVKTNPDGFNVEQKTVLSKTVSSVTFTSNLTYAHRQAGVDEEVVIAPDLDNRWGLPLPLFATTSQLLLDSTTIAPNYSFYSQKAALLQGVGDFRTCNTRFGGESAAVLFRSTKTLAYNRHISLIDPGANTNLFFDKDAVSCTSRDNWIECMDLIPQRISFVNELGTETGIDNAYISLGANTGQIWINSDEIDLTTFATDNVNFPIYDFQALGDFGVSMKYRSSSLANRRFVGSGEDVTSLFRQWARGANYNGTQITNQVGYAGHLPNLNLWFAGHYDSAQNVGGSAPNMTNAGYDTATGLTLSKWTATQDGYYAPQNSSLDPDDPTYMAITLNNQLPWGAGLAAGTYTFSAYIYTSAETAFEFNTAPPGTGGHYRFPFISTAGSYRRIWFPFHFDGINSPSFTFVTEGTIKSGDYVILGLFMVNHGSEPAPYLYPTDVATAPTTNTTVVSHVPKTYYATSATPPTTGTYQPGDVYLVQPPQAATNNAYICTASPHTWVAMTYSAITSGSAGGDLAGTYPAPTVVKLTGTTGLVDGTAATAGLKLGTTPAASGILRVPNNTFVKGRLADDSADATVAGLNSSNHAQLGASGDGGGTDILSAGNTTMQAAGNTNIQSGVGSSPYSQFQLTSSGFTIFKSTSGNMPITWDETNTPLLQHNIKTSNVAPTNFNITTQAPYASASGANRVPGSFIVSIPVPSNSGTTEGAVLFERNGASPFTISWDNSTGLPWAGIGTTVADTGILRLRSNTGIYARNYGDSGNIALMTWNSSNQIQIGNNDTYFVIRPGANWQLTTDGSEGYLDANTFIFRTSGGSGNVLKLNSSNTMLWQGGSSTVGFYTLASDIAPASMSLLAQSAYVSAATNTTGGDLKIGGGAKVGSGVNGYVDIQNATTQAGGGFVSCDGKLGIKIGGTIKYFPYTDSP